MLAAALSTESTGATWISEQAASQPRDEIKGATRKVLQLEKPKKPLYIRPTLATLSRTM